MGKIFREYVNNKLNGQMLCKNCFDKYTCVTLFLRRNILNDIETVSNSGLLVEKSINTYSDNVYTKGFFSYLGKILVFDENPLSEFNIEVCNLYCNVCNELVGYELKNDCIKYIFFSLKII